MTRSPRHENRIQPRSLAIPNIAEPTRFFAPAVALLLRYRHLPYLCDALRRTRSRAPDLSHQEDAGKDRPPRSKWSSTLTAVISPLLLTHLSIGVHYMHLVDPGAVRIERNMSGAQPTSVRAALAPPWVLPRVRDCFFLSMTAGALGPGPLGRPSASPQKPKKAAGIAVFITGIRPCWLWLRASLRHGTGGGSFFTGPRYPARTGRAAAGLCPQVLAPGHQSSAINLLTRHGIEFVLSRRAMFLRRVVTHLPRARRRRIGPRARAISPSG